MRQTVGPRAGVLLALMHTGESSSGRIHQELDRGLTGTADTDAAALEAAALASEKVQEHIGGKEIAKIIVVPKRLVNIAVKG